MLDDRVPLETCGLLNDKADVRVTLPDWVRTRPGSEPAALPVVTPSYGVEAAATPDSAFARGKLIHRLLQSLPDLDDSQREAAARRFLANPQHRLTLPQQEEIGGEVVTLLRNPAYAPLFGQGSRAEVPLVGLCAGRTIVGQVDRLWVSEKEVWIVDYKTNRPPPARAEDIPDVYRVQLAGYRDVLRLVYPDKALRCFLLWTYAPRLMEVVV